MNINFYLDSKSKKQDKIIFCYIRGIEPYKKIMIHTGERINPKYWNKEKQQAKKTYPDNLELNEKLNNIKKKIISLYRSWENKTEPLTNEIFKNEVLNLFKKNSKALTFNNIYDLFIESKKHNVTKATLKKLITIKNILIDFSKYNRIRLDLEKFNLEFFEKLRNYLIEIKNHSNNTIHKNIQFIKTFLIWCNDRGFINTEDFRKFKTKETQKEIITLTEQELFEVYKFDLSNNLKLDKVRDVFCFACFTGARYSDVKKLSYEDIKNNIWTLRTEKTKDLIQIPLNQFAIEILNKYKNISKPLPSLSNQKANTYLKELMKLVGINEPVKVTKYIGAEKIEIVKPKYEFIGTHTARRTFITISLEKGLNTEILMSITGHKDYKMLKKYINITNKVKQKEFYKVWNEPENKLRLVK